MKIKILKTKKYFNFDKVYKNYILTSDIMFHSLIGKYNMTINYLFDTGLQIILRSYNFILDILYDIDNTSSYSLFAYSK